MQMGERNEDLSKDVRCSEKMTDIRQITVYSRLTGAAKTMDMEMKSVVEDGIVNAEQGVRVNECTIGTRIHCSNTAG